MSEEKIEIPESVTDTVYAHMELEGYAAGKVKLSTIPWHEWEDYKHKYKLLGEQEVTIKLPKMSEDEVRGEIVEGLKSQQKDIDAKAYAAKREIQDRIDSLLQITYQVEA